MSTEITDPPLTCKFLWQQQCIAVGVGVPWKITCLIQGGWGRGDGLQATWGGSRGIRGHSHPSLATRINSKDGSSPGLNRQLWGWRPCRRFPVSSVLAFVQSLVLAESLAIALVVRHKREVFSFIAFWVYLFLIYVRAWHKWFHFDSDSFHNNLCYSHFPGVHRRCLLVFMVVLYSAV